jgi:outer membrane receptor protein involved in Fe transport
MWGASIACRSSVPATGNAAFLVRHPATPDCAARSLTLASPHHREQAVKTIVKAQAAIGAALGIALALGLSAPARAGPPSQPALRPLLADALQSLAARSGISILFRSAEVAGRRARSGVLPRDPQAALSALLQGTGLRARPVGNRSYLVERIPAMPRDTDAPPAPPPSGEVAPIVVTALRRPTLLEQTPASLIVIPSTQMASANARQLSDVAAMAPSLASTSAGNGLDRLSMRGIYGSGEASVGLYYGNAPVAGPAGSTSDPGFMTPNLLLVDIDRVEVLRGPQGTLYGAGSLAGTVRILFAQPDLDRWSAAAEAQAGDDGHFASFVVNAPLIVQRIAARAVLYGRRQDGVIDNIRLDRQNIDMRRDTGGRLSIKALPAEGWEAVVEAAWQRSAYADFSASAASLGRDHIDRALRLPFSASFWLASATAQGETPLGDIELSASRSRWRPRRSFDFTQVLEERRDDADACTAYADRATGVCSPAEAATFNNWIDRITPALIDQPLQVTSTTAEGRLSGAGRLNWTAGLFYNRRDDRGISRSLIVDPATGLPDGSPPFALRSFSGSLSQFALFGDATVRLRRWLDLTGGLRYFRYDKAAQGDRQVANLVTEPWGQPDHVAYRYKASGLVGRARADIHPATDMLIYFQVAGGFRPGGVNIIPGLDPNLAIYREDRVTSYEAGGRVSLLRRAVQLDAALYRQDWADMQYAAGTTSGAFGVIANIGRARIDGAEIGLSATPARRLDIRMQATWTDARLAVDQSTPLVTTGGRKGDRLPYVAPFAISAGVGRRWPTPAGLTLRADAQIRYVGRYHSEFRQTSADDRTIGGHTLAAVQAALESTRWTLTARVDNVANDRGATWAASNSFTPDARTLNPPRSYSLTLAARF